MTIHATTTVRGTDVDRRFGAAEVQVCGADGSAITLIQFPDGTIEVRTSGMARSGHAIEVGPTGFTQPIRR